MYLLSLKGLPYSFAMKCFNLSDLLSPTLPLVTIRSMIPPVLMMIGSLKPLNYPKKTMLPMGNILKNPMRVYHSPITHPKRRGINKTGPSAI